MSGWRGDIWGPLKELFAPGVIAPDEKDPGVNPYTGPTKSELVTETIDTSKALHSDGNWYLIPRLGWLNVVPAELGSTVMHVCSKSWVVKSNPDERGVERMHVQPYIVHRFNADELEAECEHCSERPPESVVALWTLHNWDYLLLNDHTA